MKNIKDLFEKVRYYNSDGQSKTAFELLINATKNNSNLKKDIIFNLELGQTLLGLSQFNDALECFRKVLAIEKNNIYAQKGKIKCLYKLKKHIDIKFLQKIFESDKNDRDIRYIFADILIINKKYDLCLSIIKDPFYPITKTVFTNKKQIISAINYILQSPIFSDKNAILFELFQYVIKNKIPPENDLTNTIIDIILRYLHNIDYNKQIVLKEDILKHYNTNHSSFETIKYLIKIIKIDELKDTFFDILCTNLKSGNLTVYEKNKIKDKLIFLIKKSKNLKFKNIILNEIEILQRKTSLKSKPRKMHVLLTSACNLKCIMCYIPKRNFVYTINEKFIKFIKKSIPYLETLTWQGGEVFLHKKFKELFELAGKHEVKQNIITSGLLLDAQLIDLIMKYDTDLTISIDSADPETYEKIRLGANFKKLSENLEILKKYKKIKNFHYQITSVIMAINYKQLENLVIFAISYGFNLISFQKIICNHDNQFLSLTVEQEKETYANIQKLKAEYENLIKIQTDIFIDEDKPLPKASEAEIKENDSQRPNKNDNDNLFCFAPWTQIFFDFDNVVKIDCNSMPLMLASKGGIWNNENIVTYRKAIVNNKVTYCNQFCYDTADHKKKTEKFKDL